MATAFLTRIDRLTETPTGIIRFSQNDPVGCNPLNARGRLAGIWIAFSSGVMQTNPPARTKETKADGISPRIQRKLSYGFLILAFLVSVSDIFRLMRSPVEVCPTPYHQTHPHNVLR